MFSFLNFITGRDSHPAPFPKDIHKGPLFHNTNPLTPFELSRGRTLFPQDFMNVHNGNNSYNKNTDAKITKLLALSKEPSYFVGGSYALYKFLNINGITPTWKPNDVDIFLPVVNGPGALEQFDAKVEVMLDGWDVNKDITVVSRHKFENFSGVREDGRVVRDRDTGEFLDERLIPSNYGFAFEPHVDECNNHLVAITNYHFIESEEEKSERYIGRYKPPICIQFVGISAQNGTREEGINAFKKWSDLPSKIIYFLQEEGFNYKDQYGNGHTMSVFKEKFDVPYDTIVGIINGWFYNDEIHPDRKGKYEDRGFYFKDRNEDKVKGIPIGKDDL